MPEDCNIRFVLAEPDIINALRKACLAKGGMAFGTYARMVLTERLTADGFLSTQTDTAVS